MHTGAGAKCTIVRMRKFPSYLGEIQPTVRTMRVGLVFDTFDAYPWIAGEAQDADAEYEPEATVEALEAALQHLGHQPVRIGTAHQLLQRLPHLKIDAAINIAEGARSRNREAYAPILLEMAGIPYTGSDGLTLSLSLDKAWTKDLAVAAGVATPAYCVVPPGSTLEAHLYPAPFPLFVKPRYEGSSKGIIRESRVTSPSELDEQVQRIHALYDQDALVEAFVEGGGEYTVAVVGNNPPEPLPALQRAVDAASAIGLHALDRRGYNVPDMDYRLEGGLEPALEDKLQRMAVQVFEKLECQDFARIDFRVDAAGEPWFLEINPLPTFAPDGTFAILAELMGKPYPDFLAEALDAGLRRITQSHQTS